MKDDIHETIASMTQAVLGLGNVIGDFAIVLRSEFQESFAEYYAIYLNLLEKARRRERYLRRYRRRGEQMRKRGKR